MARTLCPLLSEFVNRNETRVVMQDAEARFAFALNGVFNSVGTNEAKIARIRDIVETFNAELGADKVKALTEKLANEHTRKVRR